MRLHRKVFHGVHRSGPSFAKTTPNPVQLPQCRHSSCNLARGVVSLVAASERGHQAARVLIPADSHLHDASWRCSVQTKVNFQCQATGKT